MKTPKIIPPLFLYLSDTDVSEECLARIREAGYIPMKVSSLDAIRVVTPVAVTATDPIARLAFQVLLKHPTAHDAFGKAVISMLNDKPNS